MTVLFVYKSKNLTSFSFIVILSICLLFTAWPDFKNFVLSIDYCLIYVFFPETSDADPLATGCPHHPCPWRPSTCHCHNYRQCVMGLRTLLLNIFIANDRINWTQTIYLHNRRRPIICFEKGIQISGDKV